MNERTWAPPIRFDPDDQSTWPPRGVNVLTLGINGSRDFVVSHLDEFDGEFWWLHESPERVAEASVTAWWPLPEYPHAWADGETQESERKAET